MTSRRYFLIQGALASTAVIALKPLATMGRATSWFTDGNYGKLAYLHTSNLDPHGDYQVIQYMNEIKNNNANAIFLKAGPYTPDEAGSHTYDACINGENDLAVITGDYKIIHKANIKTGIISAKAGDSDVIQKVNALSAYLKKEKRCTVVICLSQLGYQNEKAPDDISLAKKSSHLDIIIGGHADNFHTHPIIALNSKNGEVIIHSAAGDPAAVGKIELDFDGQGKKKYVDFINTSSHG
jgi:2',3'-cyclic-nucleotide 2'-phosphodiesterase (5'-nucleotidase family)